MPAGQELTQPMFIQSTNQTTDTQVTQVSTEWALLGDFLLSARTPAHAMQTDAINFDKKDSQ